MKALQVIKIVIFSLVALSLAGCSKYGDFDEQMICRAGIAAIKKKSPSIVNIDRQEETGKYIVYHVSYKRADDGKLWKYRCKIDRKRMVWSQGKGRWRDKGQDPTVKFEIDDDFIEITEKYPDGTDSKKVRYNISLLR
ncbi:hypothetical protein [Veronia pacifica]|uniref:Lipoprotein n=1 Tax=Veronia pacifica TaxID=1080227 RepID=A0A1C3EDQ8_9GAMM|nr:hypothetical protein [Veronia pacifica]ODA31382.1 hypothetical protein A8L45_17025 [Veronia pacifica]